MAVWKRKDIYLAGRLVRIAEGAQSQTINVCTSQGVLGRYERKVRLRSPYATVQELEEQTFSSVDELVEYLVREHRGVVENPGQTTVLQDKPRSAFGDWVEKWRDLAEWRGLDRIDVRIASALALWREPIPGAWMRGPDPQLLGPRYRRGDRTSPHPGEHAIEAAILEGRVGEARCPWGSVVDGVNAFPLTMDPNGGRRGNIEADVCLLVRGELGYRLLVIEVKASSNNAWHAAVQNLRQVKLTSMSEEARRVMHRRNPELELPEPLPLTGLVIAPADFFGYADEVVVEPVPNGEEAPVHFLDATFFDGKPYHGPSIWDDDGEGEPQERQSNQEIGKESFAKAARVLLERVSAQTDADAYLATWDAGTREIRLFE